MADMQTIKNQIREIIGNESGNCVHVADKDLTPVTLSDIKRLKRLTFPVRLIPYREKTFDCDDFSKVTYAAASFIIPGRAFGMIWAYGILDGYHACNCFLHENEAGEPELWIYEPQNGEYKKAEGLKGPIMVMIG